MRSPPAQASPASPVIDTNSAAWGPHLPIVPLAVVGSLLVHVGAFAAVRALPQDGSRPAPEETTLAFEVEALPEPEPELAPPPPPLEPELAPIVPARALVRPEPEEPAPEPEGRAPEPREVLANADDDAPAEPDPDVPFEQEGSPDPMAGQGIASSEGGLAVGARAGDGSGLRGGKRFQRGQPVPDQPAVDYQALANQWMRQVNRIINKRAGRSYPLAARRERLQGSARVAIFVDASGRITAVRIARSSGHEVLDRAALATVQALGQVPPPPEPLRWQGQHPVKLPINYRLP